jgi:hypothetical protein
VSPVRSGHCQLSSCKHPLASCSGCRGCRGVSPYLQQLHNDPQALAGPISPRVGCMYSVNSATCYSARYAAFRAKNRAAGTTANGLPCGVAARRYMAMAAGSCQSAVVHSTAHNASAPDPRPHHERERNPILSRSNAMRVFLQSHAQHILSSNPLAVLAYPQNTQKYRPRPSLHIYVAAQPISCPPCRRAGRRRSRCCNCATSCSCRSSCSWTSPSSYMLLG